MIIEAITGFFSGYFLEKMMQENIKPYQISLVLVLSANLLSFAHQLFILGESVTILDLYRALAIFVPIYFAVWWLVSYFYKKEMKKRCDNELS